MGSHREFAISLVTGSTPVFSPTHHNEGATRRKAANNPISAIAHPCDKVAPIFISDNVQGLCVRADLTAQK